jgi:hypothetical protein
MFVETVFLLTTLSMAPEERFEPSLDSVIPTNVSLNPFTFSTSLAVFYIWM